MNKREKKERERMNKGILLAVLNLGLGILNAAIAVVTNNLFSAGAAGFCIGVGVSQLIWLRLGE